MGILERNVPTLSPGLWARRKAMTKGLMGESPIWRMIGIAIFIRLVLRKLMRMGPETVFVERLKDGDGLLLTSTRKEK
jgi:hypothetical protein